MAERTSPGKPAGGKLPILVAAAVVVLALAVGAYFIFGGKESPVADGAAVTSGGPAAVGDEALVGGGHVGDIQAFLDRSIPADDSGRLSYQVQDNKLLKLSSTSPDGRTTITADEIEFKALDTDHQTPYFADVRIKGMRITPPAGTLPGGLSSLDLDLVYAYAFDEATGTLALPVMAVDLKGLAKINLSGSLSGLTGPVDTAAALVGSARIDRLNLVIDDETLFKVLLETAAQRQGMDLATLTGTYLQEAQRLEQSTSDPLTRQIATAVRVVLQKVEDVTLTMTATPAQPYPVAALVGLFVSGASNLNALRDLNLTVTAE